MKLGITSIGTYSGMSRFSCVARSRNFDGTVSPSLCKIEKRVIGKKVRSLPTRVMSVPCKVVTMRGAARPKICRAR